MFRGPREYVETVREIHTRGGVAGGYFNLLPECYRYCTSRYRLVAVRGLVPDMPVRESGPPRKQSGYDGLDDPLVWWSEQRLPMIFSSSSRHNLGALTDLQGLFFRLLTMGGET